jgi:Tfp pilus assembly protein PilF
MKTRSAILIFCFVFICIVLVLIIRLNLTGLYSKISPDSSKEECLESALRYIEKDEPESAIYPLLLAIQKDENDARSHSLLAKAYYLTGVYHLAEKECKSSLKLDPENREGMELLCRIKFDQGRISWE